MSKGQYVAKQYRILCQALARDGLPWVVLEDIVTGVHVMRQVQPWSSPYPVGKTITLLVKERL